MLKVPQSVWKHWAARSSGLFFALLFALCTQAHSQCSSPANAIVAENCQPGSPSSEWDVSTGDAGDPTIQGFATDISVNQGGTIYFKISTPAKAYSINIYRMGYYQGLGARKIASVTPSVSLPQTQPACVSNTTVGLADCGNWAVSASWQVPSNAASGIYFAHLIRSDTGGDSHIVFVVRNDSSTSAILYKTSDESWQAYNEYGNGSLYGPDATYFDLLNRSYKVSYNRPVLTRGNQQESNTWVFGAEYPMIEFLEQNGFDISYSTGIDAARNGSLFLNHKIIMDSGHDEYISGPERATIQAARDAGVNLAFFSGNEMFWKTRWENSIDGNSTPYRTLVCYKETLAFAKLDPQDPPTWTGTWRDPTFSPPADGGQPENALTGTLFRVNGGPDDPGDLTVQVPQADGQMRLWRNTAIAQLAPGATYTLVEGSLGFEWDVDADNGSRPPGAFELSTSNYVMTQSLLLDYGGTYGAGPATHHMMEYRAPSGALVFGSGTVNYAWGLNVNHDNPFEFDNPNPDPNMQQAVINLFADMGVQPTTLASGLTPATASTDKTPPVSVITTPIAGSNINSGNTITISGTATDVGGMVAGVEVSGDGGNTWHPATGRSNWSYAWTPTVVGNITLLSRAVDDSGNLETPSDPVVLSVAPQACPCTIFSPSSAPSNVDSGDPNAIEVGVKFRVDADGSVLGVRFYKATANTGTHIGYVWSSTGTLLGTATFTNESATGWQQVNFSSPIPVTANTTYVASYSAPVGHYSADSFTFQQAGVDNPPLHALATGVDGQDGVYIYGPAGTFPTSSYNASNYWVDVLYTSSNTYSISGAISGYGGAGATVTLSGPINVSTTADPSGNYSFDGIVNGSYTVSVSNPGVSFTPPSQSVTIDFAVATGVNFSAVVTNPLSISGTLAGGAGGTVNLAGAAAATTTADPSGNYSFNGLLPGSYTITAVESGFVFDPNAQAVTLSNSNASGVNFTAEVCTCISIFPSTATPALIDSTDNQSVEVGVKFTADSPAYLTAIRFYKAATNTGTHIGHLWDSSGNLLATVTFVGETASGWQQASLSTPIWIQANTPYIASYLAPVGHYSADINYFATSGVNRPPLHALAAGVDGPNGVYVYTTAGAYPTNSYESTNYWVDVLYAAQPNTISGTITGTGGAGATVTLSGTSQATATADPYGNYSFTGIYGGTYSIVPSSPGVVFSPGNQNVTVTQSNVTGVDFTVPQICPCDTIWTPTAAPVVADAGDPNALELGVKVRADSDGYILGVRFYKAPANGGAHIGNLWADSSSETSGSSGSEGTSGTAPGSLLATANFTNETATGWQQVLFTTPIPVVANTTYIASYFAPMGHYAADENSFATAGVDSPPLHALEQGVDGGNGIFTYSPTSALPLSSYDASNYWVDVVYAPTTTYTIDGTVTGTGNVGATITLTGPSTATATTDANGNYSFNGLANGVYTVTPSEAGIIFTPASQSVTINGGHQLGVSFSSGAPTYPVSGQVAGAPGIQVTLAGATTTTTVADSNGNFTFPTVANGTYTITPAGPGYAVTPLSQSITVSSAAVPNINFTATIVTYSISGTITGGAGAAVNLTGPSSTSTMADSFGNYSFTNLVVGTYSIVPSMTGVVFNPGNLTAVLNGSNITGANFTVPQNCPCDTIWAPSVVPATIDSGDPSSVEIGVKFRADADAYITGVRFYKAAANIGTHIGNIWSDAGTLLGTATFSNESASGWQQVLFANPIPVSANTTYIASYFAPNGHYSDDTYYFMNAGVDSPPLHALADGVDGPDGVFLYTATSGFPNQSFDQTNYWVDVIYTPTSTYSVGGTIIGPGGPGASVALSGTNTATATADPSGNFVFYGLANGSYVVTPTETGYSYTPATLNATINGAHALGLSFSSAGASFTISGVISGAGGPGATVTLTGTSSATVTADPSGNYSFPSLPNGTYTVTASNTGYVFSPPSQAVTVNGANTTAGFSSAAQTYALTGTISGPGGPGATVSVSGTGTATATADPSGNFSFPALINGTYTVTASNAGYVFTPPSQAITISSANATLSFSSAPQTYTVSGTISGSGGNGATVMLAGAANATTFASSTGTYSFPGIANGAYTVSVVNAGYTFAPPSQSVTVNGANATANFSSTLAAIYTISGTISGAGGSGATLVLSGTSNATTTAGASGTYSFTALTNGVYSVTVAKSGYVFTPAAQTLTISGAGATANFSSAAIYTISGTITGAGGAGATVTLTGATTVSTTASANGAYSFAGITPGAYTITPTNGAYAFTPVNRSITVTNANLTENFATVTYTISGTITGPGASGATVKLAGTSTASTTTNYSGSYSFASVNNGQYTVTVTKTGYIYAPASQAVTVSGANATVSSFSSAATYTISGTITGAGGAGATVALTGASTATTTANTSGVYSFTVTSGAYTVTPTNGAYVFTPVNREVIVNNGNLTENFATVTYTVSGSVTGPGANSATVSLTGTAVATTTTNFAGNYSFTAVNNGSYTVTATKSGYLYSPASQAVTVKGANVSVANFTSTASYTISGTISGVGGNGATVTLTGARSATTTASSTGAYSFTGLLAGAYTITPTNGTYTFTPTNRAVTVTNGNLTENFATVTYTISGSVTGPGANGATVTLAGTSSATTTTNFLGNYSFTVTNGSYTVTATQSGYVYSPSTQSVTVKGANATVAAFSSTAATYTISGTISGAGGSGATVRLTGAANASVTASSTGTFTFSGLANGSYTVTPTKSGHTFTPTSESVTINKGNVTGVNFNSR
jgi:hypothetical protein